MRYGAVIPHRDIGFVSDRRVVSEVTALRGAMSGAPECGGGEGVILVFLGYVEVLVALFSPSISSVLLIQVLSMSPALNNRLTVGDGIGHGISSVQCDSCSRPMIEVVAALPVAPIKRNIEGSTSLTLEPF